MNRSGNLRRTPMPQRNAPLPRGQLSRSLSPRHVPRTGAEVKPLRKAQRDTGPNDATRELVKGRDSHSCVRCGRTVTGQPYSVHHRKRRSQGGRNDPENLILLCGTGTLGCHGWVHRNIVEAQASGWLVKGAEDPARVSVMVFSEYGSGASVLLTPDGRYDEIPPWERGDGDGAA